MGSWECCVNPSLMIPCTHRFLGAILAPALLAFTVPAFAATYTWDGAGANTNWTTPENWSPDGAPVNDGTSTITFLNSPAPSAYASVVDTPYNINKIAMTVNLTGSSTAFKISGSTLTFSKNGATSPSITVSVPVGTPNYNNSNLDNEISNNIVLNDKLSLVVGDGTHAAFLRLSGNISGNYGLDLNGTLGTIRLTGNNSFTGGVSTGRTSLEIGSDTALGTGGAFTLTGGSTNYAVTAIGGTRTIANDIVLGVSSSNGDGSVRFGGTFIFNGNVTLGNATTSNSYAPKMLRVASGGSSTFNGTISTQTLGAGTISGAANDFRLGGASSSESGSVANAASTKIILNGNGSYTGATIVGYSAASASYGTVFFNGDYSSSSGTQVYNGMVIRGTGTVKTLTVDAGAILAPGGTGASATTIGTLHVVGDVTLNGADDGLNNAIFRLNMTGGLSPASDKVAITGTGANFNIADNVSLVLTLTGGALQAPVVIATWVDAVAANSYGSFASITLNGSTSNWTTSGYSVVYGTNNITVIPEPGTVALVIAAGLGLVIFRRRALRAC